MPSSFVGSRAGSMLVTRAPWFGSAAKYAGLVFVSTLRCVAQ
jgi:hypothetical protein